MVGDAIEKSWERFQALAIHDANVRTMVGASWLRSTEAGVSPALACAPRVMNEDALVAVRETVDWLRFTDRFAGDHSGGEGNIVTFFDTQARLLVAAGDPRIRAIASEVNFAPGGLWTEAAVGTNGPGTALATKSAVYIAGAEHYAEAWHRWHCAAVPIRDTVSGDIVGVVDLSSNATVGAPQTHLVQLVTTIAIGIELLMRNAALERRLALTDAFFRLAQRYPSERISIVDRSGVVIAASAGVPPAFAIGQRASEDVAEATVVDALFARGERIGTYLLFRPAPAAPAAPARPGTRYEIGDLHGGGAIATVRTVVEAAAKHDLPVVILGESGVGKEVVAQSIHAASARRARPFIAVNCGAIAPSLLESELFGHAPGAFTGARRHGASGKFEDAEGGTLFLDEIAELPLEAQPALLRVLQEREVTRIGESRPRPVDVRIVVATNRSLDALRRDLYWRLAVVVCEVPPLRDRLDDLPLLLPPMIAEASAEVGRTPFVLADDALAALAAHTWPGNVRELKNTIRRVAGTVASARVTAADLGLAVPARGVVNEGGVLDEARVRDALARATTVNEAAKLLGVGRSTLYRHLDRLGLRIGRTVRSG